MEQELEKLLQAHDWYYERSDDPSVYKAGKESASAIHDLKHLDRYTELFNHYAPEAFKIK